MKQRDERADAHGMQNEAAQGAGRDKVGRDGNGRMDYLSKVTLLIGLNSSRCRSSVLSRVREAVRSELKWSFAEVTSL